MPYCIEIFNWLFFICSNLRYITCCSTNCCRVLSAIPSEEVGCCTTLRFGPAKELEAFTRRCAFAITQSVNRYCLIDFKISIFSVDILCTVVLVPGDVSWDFFFLIFVYCLELHVIGIMTIFIHISWIYDIMCCSVRYLRIVHKNRECLTRKDFDFCILITGSIPLLNDPVLEYFACRCSRCSACADTSIVLIQTCV